MNELVDVYAKTEDGWKLVFQDISEDVALEIWRAGFKTGKNNFSIESEKIENFFEKQTEKLHKMEKLYR